MTAPVGSVVGAPVGGVVAASATASRIAELQTMIAQIEGRSGAAPGGFKQQLSAATAAAGPAAASSAMAAASSAGPATATVPAAMVPAAIGTSELNPSVPFAAQIEAAAARHGLDPALLAGLIKAESNFDPDVGSPAGAQGLTELMPETARSVGVVDPHDPTESIEGGAQVLREALDKFGGDVELALAAYNAGPGAVEQYDGIPPYSETQAYVPRVLGFAAEFRQGATR